MFINFNILYIFFLTFFFIIMIFFFLKHPLIMGFMLIMATLILCVFIALFSFSSWNSYILFLMFLGGILILFLYNISLIPTEMFLTLNLIDFWIFLFTIVIIIVPILSMKETHFIDSLTFLNQKEVSNFIFFFLKYNFNSIMFLISYVFLSLINIINLIYLMKDKGSIYN